MSSERLNDALERLRQATAGTGYEGNLWLVGGYVRDRLLGLPSASDDIDIVTEQDAVALAAFIDDAGLSDHKPVVYPRFGTAMVSVDGINFELVTARRESYEAGSRKPSTVEPATIAEDARRRDFTINTLLENLHSGETADPLGVGKVDLAARVIRTPLSPIDTFADDPLRMLRAVRFAARFNFVIEPDTWYAIIAEAERLTVSVSFERIRDEFNKIVMGRKPSSGLQLLLQSGLLSVFAPELSAMVGVTQNEFHSYPVWEHTLVALDNLVEREVESPLNLRLAVLLHDCGKPSTKSAGQDDKIHFYGHQDVGAEIARGFLSRLMFPHADIYLICSLVTQHMRIGEYKPDEWSDAAIRRFIRAAGDSLDALFAIHRADVSALSEMYQDTSRAIQLRERIDRLQMESDSHMMVSPLSGREIIDLVGLAPGPEVGRLKSALTDAVIDGRLDQSDKDRARHLALELHQQLIH